MPLRNEFKVLIGKVYNLSITIDKKGSPYSMIMLLLAPVPPVKPNLFRQLNLNVISYIVVYYLFDQFILFDIEIQEIILFLYLFWISNHDMLLFSKHIRHIGFI